MAPISIHEITLITCFSLATLMDFIPYPVYILCLFIYLYIGYPFCLLLLILYYLFIFNYYLSFYLK
jgi:hypothetical protein